VVAEVNAACKSVFITKGLSVSTLLGDVTLPQGDEKITLSCAWGGKDFSATVQPWEDGHLCYLWLQEQPNPAAPTLSAVRSMAPALEELFRAGSELFPLLEEQEDEHLQTLTAELCHACFRLMRASNVMGDFFRIYREDSKAFREKVALKAYFDQFAQYAEDVLADAGQTLVYSGPDKLKNGTLDTAEVQTAMLHLLSNAAKFSPKGSEIRLAVTSLGKAMRISVSSPGVMAEDVLPSAFCRYEYPEDLDPRQGAGMGLALVQAVARRHGGNVLLQVDENGTEVIMTVDVSQPESPVSDKMAEVKGGFDPFLVGLADVLPAKTFDSRNIDL
jgi:anti-sigma regulatory factor (Ser/Thr protein kinase)